MPPKILESNIINGSDKGELQNMCMRCDGFCCKIGVVVHLTSDEVTKFQDLAIKLQVDVKPTILPETGEYAASYKPTKIDEPCGFLDLSTNLCRIYEDRPNWCKQYFCGDDSDPRFSKGESWKERLKKTMSRMFLRS